MKRISITPRNKWQDAVEKLGFGFHSTNVPYWDESAYYEFKMAEVLAIEKATNELWEMCLNAVQFVIDTNQFSKFHIPEWIVPLIKKSWEEDHPSIYGRFDLAYDNGKIKMLEFNADTPTSLFESGIVQWFWLKELEESSGKKYDQFNSIHEALIDYWKYLKEYLYDHKLHFTCVKKSLEDLTTVEYMRDCAIQAKLDTKLIFIDDIGWDKDKKVFLDLENEEMKNIFKLYPYEWLVNEEFGKNIIEDTNKSLWIEPSWRMILSNKALLPILWHLYPNHEYLLKSYFEKGDLVNYVKKPILSREGANIEIVKNNSVIEETKGEYGHEGFIYQELFDLPQIDGYYNILGSWVVGQAAVGMGIRASKNLITNNTSVFVPHLIND